jgi:hypothetical protein
MMCGRRVTLAAFLLLHASSFFASFVVDLNALVAGDLWHVFPYFAQGFLLRKGLLFVFIAHVLQRLLLLQQ